MSRIQTAIERMQFARQYTLPLLDTVPAEQWFVMPQPDTTHVAWQVGHLAMAQYRMWVERWRGERPEDEAVVPKDFLTLFLIRSVPDPDPSKYPPVADLRSVLAGVYDYAMAAVAEYDEADFDRPPLKPHRFCQTRGECLFWASAHEMLHAGQIGLLRRLLGHKPMW